MKRKVRKVLTCFTVLILISVAFSLSTINVSAEEGDEPELDNDENIYFMANEEVENYDYNYSSDIYSHQPQ